jgi:hypothetical protein
MTEGSVRADLATIPSASGCAMSGQGASSRPVGHLTPPLAMRPADAARLAAVLRTLPPNVASAAAAAVSEGLREQRHRLH